MDAILYYGFLSLLWALVVFFVLEKNSDKYKRLENASRGFLIFFVFSMLLHIWGFTGWLIGLGVFIVILIAEAMITKRKGKN